MIRPHLAWLLALGAAACADSTSPAVTLVETTPPAFAAVVTQSTYESGWVPAGFYLSQYAVWVAIPPSDTADAGVVVGDSCAVFVSNRFGLVRTTGAAIRVGDAIQVWRRTIPVVFGSVQAPPGAPAYSGTQVVIVR